MRVLDTCMYFRAHVRTSMCNGIRSLCSRTISCAHACAAEHMCAQACVAAYTHACIMCTCVRFQAHVRPSMCNGVTAYIHVCTHVCASEHMCVHVHCHVHMRVLPSTGACKHVQRHACVMCTCVRFRAHARSSMWHIHSCVHACVCFRAHVLAHAFSCAHACASEDMCVQACAATYTHACSMCTCEHMCAQACVTAYVHVCMCDFMFACACYRGHVRASAFSYAHACASKHTCVQACVSCCEQPGTIGRPARPNA